MRTLLVLVAVLPATLIARIARAATDAPARPSIVWIFVDDMSANFSCYGETLIETPNVDRLAREGTKFSHAFVTAPVCSPCRSALIAGCYQTTIGAHHHRSGRGTEKIHLTGGVVPVPVLFKQAGYYTCIGGPLGEGKVKPGKTDYNFEWDRSMYDGADWSGRKPDQPFFMQVELHGGKYRTGNVATDDAWAKRVRRELGQPTSAADVKLAPYYPDDPVLREDWARYLDTVRYTDKEVGDVIARLEKEGILDQTIICFLTDHGISHARGKQFLYEEGIHVPLVLRGPGIEAGKLRNDLVEHIDLTATSLALAGIEIPAWMQGRDLLAADYQPREFVFAARDRCDETVEHIRAVRSDRTKYIRNYLNERPHLQPNRYKDGKAIVERLRELHAAGKLNEVQGKLLFAPTRPPEELYDLRSDPYELHNLADDPQYASTLSTMRDRLQRWEQETGDQGREPEPAAMYESDMAVYVGGPKRANTPPGQTLRKNIELMKRWAAEGR
jgi:arylsulfatase A-like enzyme